mgnify:CR=1 FL=1
MIVSSPHRYCRNARVQQAAAERYAFQALIGTVETVRVLTPAAFARCFKPS